MLKVELLSHTPEPDRLVAAAARLCYSAVGVEQILEKLEMGTAQKLLDQIRESGHDSPLEHVSFSFGVEGVSRALTHQLVRSSDCLIFPTIATLCKDCRLSGD